MARCRLLQLAMLQPNTRHCKLSVVVVEWLAGRNATPAMQDSFAQQCGHHAVSKPANNCAIITG